MICGQSDWMISEVFSNLCDSVICLSTLGWSHPSIRHSITSSSRDLTVPMHGGKNLLALRASTSTQSQPSPKDTQQVRDSQLCLFPFLGSVLILLFQPQFITSQHKVSPSFQHWWMKDTNLKPSCMSASCWRALWSVFLLSERIKFRKQYWYVCKHIYCINMLQQLMSFINCIPPRRRISLYELS